MANLQEQQEQQDQPGLPWLIFKLAKQCFAINSEQIVTIFQMPEDVTPMPEYPDHVRGIINLRGEITPVVEMRKYFHMSSLAQEYEEFKQMLDTRKHDHIHWVDELTRCIEEGKHFPLATDPHKCAFGQWYDQFESNNQSINFHMRKIGDPHRALHETALEAIKCSQNCDSCTRERCLKQVLDRATHEYMPEVVNLLDEAKNVFHTSYREMCIVLVRDSVPIGMIVDEVLAVEQLDMIGGRDAVNRLYRSEIVAGVAHSTNVAGEILMLDTETVFSLLARQNV